MLINFSFYRLYGLSLHYLQAMMRNPARFIEIVVWPCFEILMFSLLTSALIKERDAFLAFGYAVLSGIVYWNFTARIVQETVSQFLDDAFSKNIQYLFIAPFSLLELTFGLLIAAVFKLFLSVISLFIIIFIFMPSFLNTINIFAFYWIFLLTFYGFVLSIIALSLIFIFGERLSFVGWILSTVVQVFSCVIYQRIILPKPLYELSFFFPTSYVFESIRIYFVTGHIDYVSGLIPLLLIMFYLGMSMIILNLSFKYSLRHGVLSKI